MARVRNFKTLVFDIDGTICPQCDGDYENLEPYTDAVSKINKLYSEGHTIIFETARFMDRCKNNPIEAYKQGYEFTLNQLKDWGIKFHELWMGKPRADYYIDDKGVFFKNNWEEIYKEITSKY